MRWLNLRLPALLLTLALGVSACAPANPPRHKPRPQIVRGPVHPELIPEVPQTRTHEPGTANPGLLGIPVEPRDTSKSEESDTTTEGDTEEKSGEFLVLETVVGGATYYADKFEGRKTASGIRFRQREMYAAHRTYPFGTRLRVTNLKNGRSVLVKVVDRGPNGGAENKRRTIIDLSRRAAEQLGFIRAGRAQVRLEVLEWGNRR